MTSSLFQEALADAKQLKEIAEQNAKNAIIDSVTPKIRQFIEDQLLEGAKRHADLENMMDEEEQIDISTDGHESVDDAASPEGLAERVELLRAMNKIVESLTPEESASLIPVVEKMRDASINKPGSARIPRAVPSDVRSTHIVKENAAMQGKNKMYEVDLDELMSDEISAEDEGMHMKHMKHAEDEDMDLEYEGMEYGHGDMEEDAAVDDEMADLYESLSGLFEAEEGDEPIEPKDEDEDEDEGEEEEEEDAQGGGVPGSPEGDMEGIKPNLDLIMSELEEIKNAIAQLVSSQGAEGAPAPGAEMPPEEDIAAAPGPGATPPGAAPGPSERVYRVDETALLRELRALREGFSEKAKKPKLAGKPLPEAYAEDEDMDMDMGEAMDEPEGDPTAEGAAPAITKGHGPGKAVPFSETAKTKVMKENRDLKVSLVKHAEAIESLRGQLTEMNLFNAKLLYVNRLLQDRDLSDAQRRNIIESLDRARSLREVKLLYKGLSESIGRKPAARKPELVSESVGSRAVSPTSRPLSTSGVRLNEAVEVHRWAVLAGIGSKS